MAKRSGPKFDESKLKPMKRWVIVRQTEDYQWMGNELFASADDARNRADKQNCNLEEWAKYNPVVCVIEVEVKPAE